jgi:isopentenyl-diphosphate Delta-isomerase
MMELGKFEERKADHLRLALEARMEAVGSSGFAGIKLRHEALPELDFAQINLSTKFWKYGAAAPLFISSMTAGHSKGEAINRTLARAASKKKWPMGVGSQRRELSDPNAHREWKEIRREAPHAFLMGNLGMAQLVQGPLKEILRLVDNLEAGALFIHANALQEALQPEGTPQFSGAKKALEKLCKACPVPVVLKETGCGFTESTLKRVQNLGLAAIDLSGLGGTHWGRIEGARATPQSLQHRAAQEFSLWGESTVDSLLAARKTLRSRLETWASGGLRSGLDAAKAIALGAKKAGFAKPALVAALEGEEALLQWMEQIEFELKVALFCTGSKTPDDLRKGKKWQKI